MTHLSRIGEHSLALLLAGQIDHVGGPPLVRSAWIPLRHSAGRCRRMITVGTCSSRQTHMGAGEADRIMEEAERELLAAHLDRAERAALWFRLLAMIVSRQLT